MWRVADMRGDVPDTIYEEDEEEEESDVVDASNTPVPIPSIGPSISTGTLTFEGNPDLGSVLKDKSNVTRSPKKLMERRMEYQIDTGEERGPDAPRQPTNVPLQEPSALKAIPRQRQSNNSKVSGSSIIEEIGLRNTGFKVYSLLYSR